MIREPYQVFPYNAVLSGQDRDDQNNYHFSFNFGGDIAKKYTLQIAENNNIRNNYYSFKDNLKDFPNGPVYNDERVSIPVHWSDTALNKNLVWRIRLVENDGNWTLGNFPSMRTQKTNIKELSFLDEESKKFVLKGDITGPFEKLNTNDLTQIAVTLKQSNGQDKFAKVTKYESKYNEYLPKNKGAFTLGKVISKTETSEKYYWVVQRNSAKDEATFISREELGLDNIILSDKTGIYTSKGLVTQQEFNGLGITKSKKESYSAIPIKKGDGTGVKILTENGFTTEDIPIYTLKLTTEVSGKKFENETLRKTTGLDPNLYIKYIDKDQEKRETLSDVFTEKEIRSVCGDFKLEQAPFNISEIKYELITDGKEFSDKAPVECYQITKMSFEGEDNEALLYEIEEQTTTYGTSQLSEALQNPSVRYPVITSKQLSRSDIPSIDNLIIAKDQNGIIFSTYNLFTESEKREILERQNDWGYYWGEQIFPDGILTNSFDTLNPVEIFQNFYDSNYYFFTTEIEPEIIFTLDDQEIDLNTFSSLNSRAAIFGVKNSDNLNIKYFKWTIYRTDKLKPIYETNKIFSRDVKMNFGKFVNGYSYTIKLTVASQGGGIFYYEIPTFKVSYQTNLATSCKAQQPKHSDYVIISWPLQKNSNSNLNYGDGPDKSFEKWPDIAVGPFTKIGPNSSINYNNIAGIPLNYSSDNCIANFLFTIPRAIKTSKDYLYENKLFSLSSNGESADLIDTEGTFKLKVKGTLYPCHKLAEDFWSTDKISFDSTQALSNIIKENSLIKNMSEPDGIDNYYNILSKNGNTPSSGKLGDEANLDFYRYRAIVGQKYLIIIRYSIQGGNWTYLDSYGIDNIPSYQINKIIFRNLAVRSFDFFTNVNAISDFVQAVKFSKEYREIIPWKTVSSQNLKQNLSISVNFEKSPDSILEINEPGEITGYQIYRDEYSSMENNILLNSKFIADVKTNELTTSDGGNFLQLKDYTAHNRGIFQYLVFPKVTIVGEDGISKQKLGKAIASDFIEINDYYWFFTSLAKRDNGTFSPIETWKFLLNLEAGAITHNTQKVFHQGNSKYPKISVGLSNYITTSLSTLVGKFERIKNRIYDGIVYTEGKITQSTETNESNVVYLKDDKNEIFLAFEGFDSQTDYASLSIKNQSRDIINWTKTGMGNILKLFLSEPFENFLPQEGDNFELSIVKDENNPNSFKQLGEYNTYEDNISIVNDWNNFVHQDNLVLVKDIKGNIFIAGLSENSEQYDMNLNIYPTTISFNITQVGDIEDFIIYS